MTVLDLMIVLSYGFRCDFPTWLWLWALLGAIARFCNERETRS